MLLGMDTDSTNWLSKALVGAIIAAVGYVGKQISDIWAHTRKVRRLRRAQLVQLQSLLRATGVAFAIQNQHARRLLDMLQERLPSLDASGGFEQAFSRSFKDMNAEERQLHSLIRGITVSALRAGNSGLLKWLDADTYFKAQYVKSGPWSVFAGKLAELQSHLILWQAKFEIWIPDYPEHALVYMADEQQHGSGFPAGLDDVVDEVLKLV